MTRVDASTLGAVLAWVGHECCGGCSTRTAAVPASGWFVQARSNDAVSRPDTLVFVELEISTRVAATDDVKVRDLLDEVNACTRPDRIRVHLRANVGRGPSGDAT